MTVAEPGGGFPITSRPLRQLLGPLGVSAGGMSRQQKFIEVIATNIANAETTRTAAGGPYLCLLPALFRSGSGV